MRPLTNNERFLLSLLIVVAIVLGSIMGLRWINQTQASYELKLQQAKSDRAIAEVEIKEQDSAQKRLKWITDHETPLGDQGVAQAKVLETLKDAAETYKLEIQRQSVGEVQHGAAGVSISVSMDAKGSMESVIRWIHTFQSIKDFCAIEKCSLKVDAADPKSVIASLTVQKFFQDGSGS